MWLTRGDLKACQATAAAVQERLENELRIEKAAHLADVERLQAEQIATFRGLLDSREDDQR
jgi:hypothetical protein